MKSQFDESTRRCNVAIAMTVYGITTKQVNTRIKICVLCNVKVRIFLFSSKYILSLNIGSHKLTRLGFIALSYDVVQMNF